MKFYRAKSEKNYYKKNGEYYDFVCEDELIIEAEMKQRKLPFSSNFEPVEIKKTDTHWFFGCRFENMK